MTLQVLRLGPIVVIPTSAGDEHLVHIHNSKWTDGWTAYACQLRKSGFGNVLSEHAKLPPPHLYARRVFLPIWSHLMPYGSQVLSPLQLVLLLHDSDHHSLDTNSTTNCRPLVLYFTDLPLRIPYDIHRGTSSRRPPCGLSDHTYDWSSGAF
jgi:hypothetical protein